MERHPLSPRSFLLSIATPQTILTTLILACAVAASAQAPSLHNPDAPSTNYVAAVSDEPSYSSSSPSISLAVKERSGTLVQPEPKGAKTVRLPSNRPFSALAIWAKVGTGGAGADFATPLNRFLNLRAGFQIFDYRTLIKVNGLHADGDFTLQNGAVALDIYPFGKAFRISPGVTVHNDNHITADLLVPGGNKFSLGDTDYISDTAHPISGIARLKLGNTIAPRFTMGFGNMLPRKGGHFSFPFEAGFQYISPPTLDIILFGAACDQQGNCGDISSGDGPANLRVEVQRLEKDLTPLRFYPIVATGISYRFGTR